MPSTIAPTVLSSNEAAFEFDVCSTGESPREIGVQRPHTLVLQPMGNLDQQSCIEFEQCLHNALEQATDGVLVDLLWIRAIDSFGIAALVTGIEKASTLHKSFSLHSMNRRTKVAMEAEWEQRRSQRMGTWKNTFAADLEQYLDSRAYM
jgi:anti-anti-sigma regulatory factor